MENILKAACISLFFNIAFVIYHVLLGVLMQSWWLFSIGIYYAILCIVRFVVVITKKRNRFVARFSGAMLMLLSIPLFGTVIVALEESRGNKLHKIIMITMAAYAFSKLSIAIINLIRSRKSNVAKYVSLRNISLADTCASIFALQRSMLISFGDMPQKSIFLFNALLGTAIGAILFLLGLNLIRNEKWLLTR